MVVHSLLSVLLVAVFSQIAAGASVSGRTSLELAPRALGNSLEPRQGGVTTATSSSYEASTIIKKWSQLPEAFSQCQSVFQQHVEVHVAVQAVTSLYQKVQSVASQYGNCNCGQTKTQYSAQFKQVVSKVFTSWQTILVTGQQVYREKWEYNFKPVFGQFSSFVTTTKTLCVGLQIDLGGTLNSLGINLNLFAGIGVDLARIVGNIVGGVLNGVGDLLGGLFGGGDNDHVPHSRSGGGGLLGGIL